MVTKKKREERWEGINLLFTVAKRQFNVYLITSLTVLPIELTLSILGCVGRLRGSNTTAYTGKPFPTLANILIINFQYFPAAPALSAPVAPLSATP